ncbi:hypothetical protein BDV96DRAFT_146184 [Lophiotrema nucula]|uniref:Uncharacterized protein n=1 Tax=Lophiotrema nucula TaxID=690887 RepID=A0A6A5Z0I6_9PLEO|nr:hypothetical protein BDV96DRAFT_146184 [Lophiotrema nucula]
MWGSKLSLNGHTADRMGLGRALKHSMRVAPSVVPESEGVHIWKRQVRSSPSAIEHEKGLFLNNMTEDTEKPRFSWAGAKLVALSNRLSLKDVPDQNLGILSGGLFTGGRLVQPVGRLDDTEATGSSTIVQRLPRSSWNLNVGERLSILKCTVFSKWSPLG